jgi:hypothetical protein
MLRTAVSVAASVMKVTRSVEATYERELEIEGEPWFFATQ